jgi:hypothetical protein
MHSLLAFSLQIPSVALYFTTLMGIGTTLCMPLKKIAHRKDKPYFGQQQADYVGYTPEAKPIF